MRDLPTFYRPTKGEWGKEVIIFDVYLVCSGKVIYYIHWERTNTYKDGKSNRAYENISGDKTDKLPDYAKGDKLPWGFKYSQYGIKRVIDNPVPKANR